MTAFIDDKSQPSQYIKLIFEAVLFNIQGEGSVKEMNAVIKELNALKEPFYSIVTGPLLMS